MRDLLARIRSGLYELRSPTNEYIRSSRKARGLSMSKLANLSKITLVKLQLLETCSTAVPSDEQVTALAEILEFDVMELQHLRDDLAHNSNFLSKNLQKQIASDENNNICPMFKIEDIIKFNPVLEDFENFIHRNQCQVTSLYLDDSINNVFAIVDSNDNFHTHFPGSVRLVVNVKDFPKNNDVVIVKFRNSNSLQLKRFISEEDNIYLMPFNDISDKQVSKLDNIEWMRKVLKVVINLCE